LKHAWILVAALCVTTPVAAQTAFDSELRLIERDAAHAAAMVLSGDRSGLAVAQAPDLRSRLDHVRELAAALPATAPIQQRLQNTQDNIARVEGTLSSAKGAGNVKSSAFAAGSVVGRVTDASTDLPLSDVRLELWNAYGYWTAAWTDENGDYSFPLTNAGTYSLRSVGAIGYIEQSIQIEVDWAVPTVQNLALTRGGAIRGVATVDDSGMPLSRGYVDVYNPAGVLVTTAALGEDGSYITLRGLTSGTYYAILHALDTGFIDQVYDDIDCLDTCFVTNGTPISVVQGTDTESVNFSVRNGGRITGTVVDGSSNLPIAGATVLAYSYPSVSQANTTITNEDGTYTFVPGGPGDYLVKAFSSEGYFPELYQDVTCPSLFQCPTYDGTIVTTAVGTTRSAINFSLLNQGARIRGTVIDSATGEPIANAQVRAFSSSGNYSGANSSNAQGRYSISLTGPGTYYVLYEFAGVVPYKSESYNNVACGTYCNPTSGTPIPVAAGQTVTGIDLALNRFGSIAGRIEDSNTGLPLTAFIMVVRGDGSVVATDYKTGDYVMEVLTAGTYYVSATSSYYAPEVWNNKACPAPCNPAEVGNAVTVADGARTSGIDFSLAPGGRVAGFVRDSMTGEATSAWISLVNQNGIHTLPVYVNGAYETAPVPDGAYVVFAKSDAHTDEIYDNVQCEGGGCAQPGIVQVNVTSGTITSNINFDLQPVWGRITGRLVDAATNAPVAYAAVTVGNAAIVGTDADGRYTSALLPAGDYRVKAQAAAYVEQIFGCSDPCPAGSEQLVTVSTGATTSGIDFALKKLVVVSLAPHYGSTAGDTTVEIEGRGFDEGAQVTVGGNSATIISLTATKIRISTPAHAAAVVDVKVTNPSGISSTLRDAFTYESPVRAEPRLVHDINTIPGTPQASGLSSVSAAGGLVYFVHDDGVHGYELWKTDGTPAGTALVKDITPGPEWVLTTPRLAHGAYMYFEVGEETQATLWRTDGTSAGTIELARGEAGGAAYYIDALGSYVYFACYREATGIELWRTDGTPAGTAFFKEIVEGTGSSNPGGATAVMNGYLYFPAISTGIGRELWRTDGTESGTTLVTELLSGPDYVVPSSMLVVDDILYINARNFVGDMGLFKSDGTSVGTVLLKVFPKAQAIQFYYPEMTEWNGHVYFAANTPEHGIELWKTDGTAGGTVRVTDLATGPASSRPSWFTRVGGTLYFTAASDDLGTELWILGGPAGATLVRDLRPGAGSSSPYWLVAHPAGGLMFAAYGGYESEQTLWRSDGTADGTVPLSNGSAPVNAQWLTIGHDGIYFVGGSSSDIQQIWRAPSPTSAAPATNLPPSNATGTLSASPGRSVRLDRRIFYIATPGGDGPRLFVTNIDTLETTMVSNRPRYPENLVAAGSHVYFTADDSATGRELWRTDGTDAGTAIVVDLTTGSGSTFDSWNGSSLTYAGGLLYFKKNGLYRSDGTAGGTFRIESYYPDSMAALDGSLYYSLNVWERSGLFRSTGSGPGTRVSPDLPYGPIHSFGGRLYFNNASTGVSFDATTGVSFALGLRVTNPLFAVLDGNVYMASESTLVRIDTSGTTQIYQFTSQILQLSASGDRLFLIATDNVHGYEPWTSDGTTAGTGLLKDINPGPAGSNVVFNWIDIGRVHDSLFFSVKRGDFETMWKTDGTTEGTYLYYQESNDQLSNFVVAGTHLFFTGGGREGIEWRAIDIGPAAEISNVSPRSGPHTGAAVSISGTRLGDGTEAFFGELPLKTPLAGSATEMTGQTPVLQPGRLYDITVTDGEPSTLKNAFMTDFLDITRAHPFRGFVESIFRAGVTAGCGGGNYCGDAETTRVQMSIFLLRAKHGAGYTPPPATGTLFADVPASAFAAAWMEQLAREAISAGCGNGNFCPNAPVSRAQMAIFLLRAKHGSSYTPPDATGVFGDVAAVPFPGAWIEQLYREGITGGCSLSPLRYCPDAPVTRAQMAVFLTRALSLP
jgi:ELWxxDGT repeat protein